MKGLPIDVRALISAGSKLKEDQERPVKIAVLVEVDAPDEILDVLQPQLTPKTANAQVDVAALEAGVLLRVDSAVDAVIVVVGSATNGVTETLRDLSGRAIPTVVIALRPAVEALPGVLGFPSDDIIAGMDADELIHGPLADWVTRRLHGKHVAVAHNFAFMRRAVAKEAMRSTAWQNAAIGAVAFMPGADMPLMTLNQAKMLLQMAAAYGEDLGAERIWELAAVVGGAFVFRELARQALAFVPGFGWALKAGVAYGGTIAIGEAAMSYFESGASLPEMLEGLKDNAAKIRETARERRREWSARRAKRAMSDRPASAGYTSTAPEPDELTVAGQMALPAVTGDGGAGVD